jgi:hypothetical protein
MKLSLIILSVLFSSQIFSKDFTCYRTKTNKAYFKLLLDSKKLPDGSLGDEIIYDDGSRISIKRLESGTEWEVLNQGIYKGYFSLATMKVTTTKKDKPFGIPVSVKCKNVKEALAESMVGVMADGKLAAAGAGKIGVSNNVAAQDELPRLEENLKSSTPSTEKSINEGSLSSEK